MAGQVLLGEGGLAREFDRGVPWLTTVAHELRNPLSSLAFASEMLASDLDALDRSQIRDAVSSIRRGALWLQGLTENLLCAAAISERRFNVTLLPTSLHAALEDVGGIVGPIVAQRKQRLRVRVASGTPDVWADQRRLAQILVNLIFNASKYSPVGSPIDVVLRERAGSVRVAVLDRGPGIPRAERVRVLDPFVRLDRDADRAPGEGLGLAIARALIQAHGSSPRILLRRGGGTVVSFDLAIAQSELAQSGHAHLEALR